jgi:UDP-N-acetyl-D-glucosamine/UDP-N-acetyl-D-galactosamine dehydrogenase
VQESVQVVQIQGGAQVVDLVKGLERHGMEVQVVDPWVNGVEAQREYGLAVQAEPPAEQRYAAVVAAVAHGEFAAWGPEQWQLLLQPGGLLMDLKAIIPRELGALRL